jgi:hypothetical protein
MNTVPVKISAACARQLFRPCDVEFIRDTCHATCCDRAAGGIMVTVHATERGRLVARGARVTDAGFLEPSRVTGKCPFKSPAGTCCLHGGPDKPFGCTASPFTLNAAGTLIVRNRYRLLKCYRAAGAVPAYQAHRASLDRIFGAAEAARICAHLDAGGGDVVAYMPAESYAMLRENDAAKKQAAVA